MNELELLRDWPADDVRPSAEVRAHALAELEHQYAVPVAKPGRARFGPRLAIAALTAVVLMAGAIVWAERAVDDRIDRVKTLAVPDDVLGQGQIGKTPVNVLVVGTDNRALPDRGRSDTIILLRLDGSDVRALWIPRDLAVGSVPDGRINGAFDRGPTSLIEAVTSELGVEVDHYVQVDFSAFERMVNEVNGVPVYVPGNVRDVYSGVDLSGPGCRVLNGGQALSWVRSRHLEVERDGTWVDASPRADLDRQARQQDFLRSLAVRAQNKVDGDPLAAVRLADALVPALTIDSGFTRSKLLGLVRALVGVDPAAMQLATVPVQPATDGARVVLRQPEADQALAPFRGESPGAAVGPSSPPAPTC